VKIKAYTVKVYLNLVWAYMGPQSAHVFTPFDTLMRPEAIER
jgi:hypothetical protein